MGAITARKAQQNQYLDLRGCAKSMTAEVTPSQYGSHHAMDTPHFDARKLNDYLKPGGNRVDGWFGVIDAELFRTLLLTQANEYGVHGSVAEIGVHRGKSFIALCLATRSGERAFCVDIFSDQTLNEDHSGSGDRQILEENLRRYGVETARVVIKQASSFDVKGRDVLDAVGPVRFFSIDGGHWLEIVCNDFVIAEECLAEGGIIALDDFHRAEWPDVSAGYFSWYASRRRPIVPFAIGFNKLYLCEETWRLRYQAAIAGNRLLRQFHAKTTKLQGVELPVFSEFIFSEMPFVEKQLSLLRLSSPNLYAFVRKARHRLSTLVGSQQH
jgi:Methyltransferase domain